MIRVISGTAGGLKLQTLDSDATRPTLDRVKEAEFSMIHNNIPGATVLDLFAGSGGLGIEALSRGAARCYFNDKSKLCCETIRENLAHTHLTDKASIFCRDYSEALCEFKKGAVKFDLILLDPPYGKMLETEALRLISSFGVAVPGCIAACEHAAAQKMPDEIGNFTIIKEKKYGTVCVTVYGNEV